MSPTRLGVYIHWPYCARICPYCDFNVRRDRDAVHEKADLAQAILADLRSWAALTAQRSLVSIYFGGGTPSLMDPHMAAEMIAQAKGLWTSCANLEVTLEANPTDAEAGRFSDFAQAGITRLSLGVQSLRDPNLAYLRRNHDAATARRAIETAGAVFARVSLDLIYALPGQTKADWGGELGEAIALGPEHISPYQLTIEPGTAFAAAVRRGAWRPPGANDAADLFETTQEILGQRGYDAYEISNHAKGPAARSRHNLLCWRGEDYLGVGPGAHGRLTLGGVRWESAAPRGLDAYLARASAGEGPERRALSAREVALERLLMGMRTAEGVALADLAPLNIRPATVAALERAKLLRAEAGRIVVRPAGRLVLDGITRELAANSWFRSV